MHRKPLLKYNKDEHYHPLKEIITYCTSKEFNIKNKNLISMYFMIHGYIFKLKKLYGSALIQNNAFP